MGERIYVIQSIVIVIFLGLCVGYDLKYKRIPIKLILSFGVSAILIFALFYREQWVNRIEGMCVGILVLVISKVTGEKIGKGDGMILLSLGLLLGVREVGVLFLIAIILSAVWSVILITFQKANRSTTFPFVPFLLISYIICLIT